MPTRPATSSSTAGGGRRFESPRQAALAQRAFLAAVALLVLALAVLAAHGRPLWYDELFTLYVAREPSLAATVRALLAGADSNPPLDYLLRHVSLVTFGPSSAAFRGPSAVAFVAGLFAIYGYVRRRAPFLASAAAFLLPISTAAVYFSYEGRAYALLFASAPLALLAWQRAVDRPRDASRLLTLVAALSLGPFSHYLGALNFVPVAAGELWRGMRRRRVDWGILAAVAGACLVTLLLVPFARHATAMKATFWAAGYRLADLPGYYAGFLDYAGATALFVLAAALVLAPWSRRSAGRAACPRIPGHELVAAAALALTPFSAYLLAESFTGALTSKYAIALVAGVAVLGGYLLAIVQAAARSAVLLAVAALAVLGLGHLAAAALGEREEQPLSAEIVATLRRSTLPVAFDSPHQFLEYVHYQPTLAARRFVYPMDPATALAMRGFNNDELALRGLGRITPLNVVDYADFARATPEFLVMHTTAFASALVKALQAEGWCLRIVARAGPTILLHADRRCR